MSAPPVPAPGREALPPHGILGATAAPDGKSWCILDVRIEERVPKAALRSLWAALNAQQSTEWDRFTCRVSVRGDAWADVNEFAVFEIPREEAADPRAESEPEEPVVVEIGEDYVIYSFMGLEIKKSRTDLDDPVARHVWLRDPHTGEYKRVRVADLPRRLPLETDLTR